MGLRITVPWKIHLRGSSESDGSSGWRRRTFHDEHGARPALLQEQDLDHLGALHDAAVHSKKH